MERGVCLGEHYKALVNSEEERLVTLRFLRTMEFVERVSGQMIIIGWEI